MNRLLRILIMVLLLLPPLVACDYLPSWVPGAKSGKTAAKSPRQKPAEELPIDQQILQLQQEIQAVEEEKRKLEQRQNQIRSEKETINELLQEQEAEVQRMERELDQQGLPPAGG